MKALLAALTLLAAVGQALAQEPAARVSVEVTPPERTISIGGEVKLLITVEHSKELTLVAPTEPLWLEPFEFKRLKKASVKTVGNQVTESFTVVCTIFDLGEFKIPKIPFYLSSLEGKTQEISTDEIPIMVKSILEGDKDKIEMRPIKGPASIDRLAAYKALLWPIILVILLTILYFYMRSRAKKMRRRDDLDEQLDATAEALAALRELRRRHKNIFERKLAEEQPTYHFEKPDMEASEEAVVALLDLQNQQLVSQGMVKQFHAELSHIFRHYVGRRYGFATAEKTTSEMMALARYHGVPDRLLKWMHGILSRCDIVKFSPISPTHQDCEEVWRACWDFVMSTRPSEEVALAGDSKTPKG